MKPKEVLLQGEDDSEIIKAVYNPANKGYLLNPQEVTFTPLLTRKKTTRKVKNKIAARSRAKNR